MSHETGHLFLGENEACFPRSLQAEKNTDLGQQEIQYN